MPSMGPEEMRSRLLEFDAAVGIRFPDHQFQLVIAGGGAMAMLGVIDRPTDDIDALNAWEFPRELQRLMKDYDIRGQVAAYGSCFPDYFEDRLVDLDLGTGSVRCYSVSLEDLVVSKLWSPRPEDEQDVRAPEVLSRLDWKQLRTAVDELSASRAGSESFANGLAAYRAYTKEHAPCED